MTHFKVATMCLLFVVGAAADTFTFQGPFGPGAASEVFGPLEQFALQDVSLTTPSVPGGDWTITVHTNYGAPLPGTGPDNVIPDWSTYAAADFLISWNGGFYGVVLHSHDGYLSGNLYQSNGFETAGQVRGDPVNAVPQNRDVWLNAGGSFVGAGTVSAAPYGTGDPLAEYTITDVFQAPANFLLGGTFELQMSSADCANGYVLGEGSLPGTPPPPSVPEPAAVWLLATVLPIAGWRLRKAHTLRSF